MATLLITLVYTSKGHSFIQHSLPTLASLGVDTRSLFSSHSFALRLHSFIRQLIICTSIARRLYRGQVTVFFFSGARGIGSIHGALAVGFSRRIITIHYLLRHASLAQSQTHSLSLAPGSLITSIHCWSIHFGHLVVSSGLWIIHYVHSPSIHPPGSFIRHLFASSSLVQTLLQPMFCHSLSLFVTRSIAFFRQSLIYNFDSCRSLNVFFHSPFVWLFLSHYFSMNPILAILQSLLGHSFSQISTAHSYYHQSYRQLAPLSIFQGSNPFDCLYMSYFVSSQHSFLPSALYHHLFDHCFCSAKGYQWKFSKSALLNRRGLYTRCNAPPFDCCILIFLFGAVK